MPSRFGLFLAILACAGTSALLLIRLRWPHRGHSARPSARRRASSTGMLRSGPSSPGRPCHGARVGSPCSYISHGEAPSLVSFNIPFTLQPQPNLRPLYVPDPPDAGAARLRGHPDPELVLGVLAAHGQRAEVPPGGDRRRHFDRYLRTFARQVRAWGHPFFLRFDWEMNGFWFALGRAGQRQPPGTSCARGATSTKSSVSRVRPTQIGCGARSSTTTTC